MDAVELRELVLDKLRSMGFTGGEEGMLDLSAFSKNDLRILHQSASQMEVIARQEWLRWYLSRYFSFFADGNEVIPERIRPALIEVTTPFQHNLFRVARLLWSIPYTSGYGRRLRFLILDETNGKLIGILALQSPPLSFPMRDRLFRYQAGRKTEYVNQTMDIHTLGAVPPYNLLLGGKLVALSAVSNEIRLFLSA